VPEVLATPADLAPKEIISCPLAFEYCKIKKAKNKLKSFTKKI
jgi:hypothetical protein